MKIRENRKKYLKRFKCPRVEKYLGKNDTFLCCYTIRQSKKCSQMFNYNEMVINGTCTARYKFIYHMIIII